MQEDFLQYIWRYGLFASDNLHTSDGRKVDVLFPGQLNTNAGPDFLMARVRIGETLWAGHVEIHVKASDWYRHTHNEDRAFDPVILHVVYENDCVVTRSNGDAIPVVSLPVKPSYLANYHHILSTMSPIACETSWQKLESSSVENWIINMGIERIQTKSDEVYERLLKNKGGWEETFFQIVTRAFGFGVNQDSFDRLGQSIPFAAIRSVGTNLFRLEALLFGQADLIPINKSDPYTRALATEYDFVRKKFNLTLLNNPGWKFLRMRPSNFPTVRIAQLAAFIAGNPDFMSQTIYAKGNISTLLFDYPVSSYWKEHYDFDKKWEGQFPGLGQKTLQLLMINAFLPFKACYDHRNGKSSAWENWMEVLETLPPEDNQITRVWSGFGFRIPNAFYSQAFLYLFTHYCKNRKCLSCHIGQSLIQSRCI